MGRKKYSTDEKYRIVKEVLSKALTISDVQRRYGISNGAYYRWQETFLSGAKSALSGGTVSNKQYDKEGEHLRAEVQRLRMVVAELSAELVMLKKSGMDW